MHLGSVPTTISRTMSNEAQILPNYGADLTLEYLVLKENKNGTNSGIVAQSIRQLTKLNTNVLI